MSMIACEERSKHSEGIFKQTPAERLPSWLGYYPEPTGLRGLHSIAVRITPNRIIPPDRGSGRSIADLWKDQITEEFTKLGIMLTNDKEADAILSVFPDIFCE